MKVPSPKWDNNEIQFPRLICELQEAGVFTPKVMRALRKSMDLTEDSIDELLDRALIVWEHAKEQIR